MALKYEAIFENVRGKVTGVFEPKGAQRGYSYAIKISDPEPGLKKWLNDFGCIVLSTFDKTARFLPNIPVSITRLGLCRNGDFINAYLVPPDIKTDIEPKTQEKGDDPTPLIEQETREQVDLRYNDIEDVQEKLDVVSKIVSIVKDLTPEGQQAIMNPLFKYLGKQ